jgi:23S rRNA pseudouridine955/2504/2580 synthase
MSRTKNTSGVRRVSVDADREGQRLDNFLTANLKGVPRSAIYRIIRTGQVRINGGRCKASSRLREGDEVRIPPTHVKSREDAVIPERVLQQVRSSLIFENSQMTVVNKPSGMAVHAGSGLAWGLIDVMRRIHPGEFCELVHRLDRETSGCLVLARNGRALNHLSAQFREGTARKKYMCLMNGSMPQDVIETDAPLGKVRAGESSHVEVLPDGKPARTRFRLLNRYADCCYVEAELFTGRTHQIRAHARHLGLPLAGDEKYAGKESFKLWKRRGLKRVFLHAHRLELTAPKNTPLEFDAPLPRELRDILDSLV